MEIKVLGPGCANCQDLERRTAQALKELGKEATITKIKEIADIGKYVMMTPGLVINEKVLHQGKPLPKVDQIKEWIRLAV